MSYQFVFLRPVGLLSDDSFGRLSDRLSRYVGHIRSSGEGPPVLINEVPYPAQGGGRPGGGGREAPRVAALIEDCIGDLRPLADAKRLQLTSRVAGRLAVTADQTRLAQIVLNLLSNAIKFTDSGGRITLRADVSGEEPDGTVRFEVSDTGIGVSPDQLDRVFEPFVQVDAKLTRTREGTGLGLSISRDLARGMGGELTVVSEVGKGSTFILTLPRSRSDPHRV